MYGVSLILAPLLLAISSFFWIGGGYGVIAGTILILSMVFWMPTLITDALLNGPLSVLGLGVISIRGI